MNINKSYLKKTLQTMLETPSPSGYTHHITEMIKKHIEPFGYEIETTHKGALVITIPGKDDNYIMGLSAHVDTLGLMVRSINEDGTLKITSLGGNQFTSLDGEYCKVHTESKSYSGTVISKSPASHVYKDHATLERNADNMVIRLDEVVYSEEDVKKLGINNGDFISIDPKTRFLESGYIKSRYLDDKASVACLITLIEMLYSEKTSLPKTCKIFLSTYEEVGHGAAYLPSDISELLAVDMGCIGEDLSCTEEMVSICAKDSSGPYDFHMRKRLTNLAVKHEINHAIDIYPFYGSDASSALNGGQNIRAALIGPGVHASHGMERTHMNALIATIELIYRYIVNV